MVTFSILSPDASLSYDRIKLRLDEYRTLLASDSAAIELATENGKTVICRKQANEMEQFLDRAEILLQDVIQSRDISTLIVLHRLRDLAKVLDDLNLYDECRLTGNCALDLAEALGRRSIEFRHEQAETLALIAGLSIYQPRTRTLFIQAVSICEEVVENDPSHSNKTKLLLILDRAGYWTHDHPDLCVQWLGRAVQLITNELPSTMVTAHVCSVIYNNYGTSLSDLRQYADSIKAYQEAISIRRTLAKNDPVKYTDYLAQTLKNMGVVLRGLEKYDDAIATYKEAIELCRAISAQDPLRYNVMMAKILHVYAYTLSTLAQVSDAAELEKEAVSFFRDLVEICEEGPNNLCISLHNYALYCYLLGQHEEAVLAYQESIPLWHAWVATNPGERGYLVVTLYNMANSLHALGKNGEADAAANEVLQMNDWELPKNCRYAPDLSSCFACQRIITSDPLIFLADRSPPLPAVRPPSLLADVREHSEGGVSISCTQISIKAPSHIPTTNTAHELELGQPGVAPDPSARQGSIISSSSCLAPGHPQVQDSQSPARPPQSPPEIVKVSQGRKRDKVLRLFKRNRAQ